MSCTLGNEKWREPKVGELRLPCGCPAVVAAKRCLDAVGAITRSYKPTMGTGH